MTGIIQAEAFPRWLELTGVDPSHFDESAKDFGGSFTIGSYDSTKQAVAIHECLSIPDNELTAQLMLARYLADYAARTQFTLEKMLANPQVVQRKWDLAREISDILESAPLVDQRAGFAGALQEAMKHYGVGERPDVEALLEDDIELAQLRRDAYYGIDQMRMSQFLKGEVGSGERPRYNTVIRRWWRMEDLLASHTVLPEGVSLNLVCPSAAHELFFCFVLRRGANLFILDDAPDRTHPLQASMTRSPGRALADRMAKFWFPYELANVSMDDKGKAQVRREQSTSLDLPDRYKDLCRILGQVSDLPPHELVWTVMMLDRIVDRFWNPEFTLPQLPISYAAGHLRAGAASLLEAAQEAGLPVVVNTAPLVAVPDLSLADVASMHTQPNAKAVLGDVHHMGDRQWLEDRYANQVPQEAINLVSATGTEVARLTHEVQVEILSADQAQNLERSAFGRDNTALATFTQMDPTTFGTPERLIADRGFLARYNYAKSINALAAREFNTRKEEVRTWLFERYSARQDFLLNLAGVTATAPLVITDWNPGEGPHPPFRLESGGFASGYFGVDNKDGSPFGNWRHKESGHQHTLGVLEAMKQEEGSYGQTAFLPIIGEAGARKVRQKVVCRVNGTAPTYWFAVRPTNARELAWVLGMEVADLPDVLRHYNALSTDHANSILDRIDPMLWVLNDPWLKVNLGVRLALSKRGLAQVQKQATPVDVSSLHSSTMQVYRGEAAPPAVNTPSRRPAF